MTLKTFITDPANSLHAEVVDGAEQNALVVATRKLKTYENSPQFFINPTYGVAMNQAVSSSGTPEKVHNGTDNAYWTFSNIVGTRVTEDSADVAHTGTKSIKSNNVNVNDIFQLATGSGNLIASDYTSLDMWVYVSSDWANDDSVEIYGYDADTATTVGTSVGLQDYFDWATFNVWHKISIPLTDMNLQSTTTVDTLRVANVVRDGAKSPLFYLDDIQFEQTGSSIGAPEYTIEPAKNKWLHVDSLKIILADEYAGTVSDGTMPSIPYDGFLGVDTLDVGITYKRTKDGEVVTSFSFRNLADFLILPGATVTSAGSDGTNTWMTLEASFIEPVILKSETQDKMSFTVNDDLSRLLLLRTSAGCREEDRFEYKKTK